MQRLSFLSSRLPSSCSTSVNRLQTRVVLYCCVCFCRAASVLTTSNHETVREWLREHRLPSRSFPHWVLYLYLVLDFDGEGAPAYFAICRLPNISTRLGRGRFYGNPLACRFYPRDAMLARVIVIATCLSVCPSVCHAPVLCQNEES